MSSYLSASHEAGKAFYQQFHNKGEIVMLNLLLFREMADYTGLEALKPDREISGKEAYELYMQHTLPFLEAAGGSVLYYGKGAHFLIGPVDKHWDAVLLVKHLSAERFIAFAQNSEYLAIAGHRTAALADSRLLPSTESTLP
ncbi:MAG: DUF1330 domain-containing protein [Bacteroidia bacterium]